MPSGAKVDILNTALELDRRRQNIERITVEYGAVTHLIEAKQAENDLALRAFMQDRQQVEGLQLEIDLIGKTTYEQQQLTAARQIDLQTKQRTYEALATLPEDASADEIDRIVRAYRLAAERQKGIVSDLLRTRREAERSWEMGSRDAFKSYVDNATNAAEAARTVFTDAFRGMEDALVEFVKTGKFNFKDLVNTIETDLIRIGVRQAITVPLANAVGPGFGALGGLFGFGAGAGAGALAMGGGAVPLTAEEAFLSGSAPAAASFSWLPPIAAGAGLAYAYQSGVANQSFPIFGKLGNAIDSVFPGVGSLLGMGGGRGPKNPQMGLLEQPGGGFYIGQMNSGDDAFAQSSIAPLISQINDRTKYDQAMLHQLVGYMSGSVGTSPDQMLAMLMQRLSSAALPDFGALESQQTALYRQLMGVANPDALGITGLQRYQEALSVSDLAGGPMDRLGSARSIYETTLARARAGDLSAINQFPQVAQQLLGIGRDVYASGSGFQDLFVGVNQALNEVLDHQRSLQADLLKDVPASIQQASIDQVKAIRDQTTALSDELRAVQEELRRVRNAIAA
jgi:lambda family phage tail tape measure protein